MFNITITGDKELIARLDKMPDKIRIALRNKVTILAADLRNYVIQGKLSGQVLNKRTGMLQQSIQREVEETSTAVVGKVFSAGNVKYAAIHEFGGQIPAHEILPNKADALSFILGGKRVFFKRVNHPGCTMPERSFMRSALADMKNEIIEGLKDAVAEGMKQ